jgi:hypothetical protein
MSRWVWALVNDEITQHMSMTEEPSAKQWLFTMIDSLDQSSFVEMTVTLWAIWFARRRLIHEGEQQCPLSTYLFVRSFLQDLGQIPSTQPRQIPKPTQPVWIAPLVGQVKLNVDAAVTRSGAGQLCSRICRSGTGDFLGASTLTVAGAYTPASLEAMACREALSLAQDLHLQHLCVASDCLEVIKNLNQPYQGIYGAVIREIKDTIGLFSSVVFRFESRSSNGEAHRLARSSVSLDCGRRVWLIQPAENLCIPLNILNNQ